MAQNPEIEFVIKNLSTYDGMKLEERTFAQLLNYHGELQDYKLDIMTSPEETDEIRPVVIFLHGGGFVQPCDKRQVYVPMFAQGLTKAGYVVIAPDYPVYDNEDERNAKAGPDMGAARAAEAVHLVYQYIIDHARELKVDPERIAIMGGSAGGFTAFYLLSHYNDQFRAFGNCWGSPFYELDLTGFPPTISIHGTADKAVNYAYEAPIQEKFEKLGIPHELITLEGEPHTPLACYDIFMPKVLDWMKKYL